MIQLSDHRRVAWEATFVGGLIRSSRQCTWSEFSEVRQSEGVSLAFSKEPIEKLLIWVPNTIGGPLPFIPQVPTEMFALTHMRVDTRGYASWCYSLFGFYEGNYRKMLRITSSAVESLIESRATLLSL